MSDRGVVDQRASVILDAESPSRLTTLRDYLLRTKLVYVPVAKMALHKPTSQAVTTCLGQLALAQIADCKS